MNAPLAEKNIEPTSSPAPSADADEEEESAASPGNDPVRAYLRKILIHGARAVVLRSKRDRIAMGAWMTSLETRAPRNVLIVATAHKLARIAWAALSTGQDYRAVPEALTV